MNAPSKQIKILINVIVETICRPQVMQKQTLFLLHETYYCLSAVQSHAAWSSVIII